MCSKRIFVFSSTAADYQHALCTEQISFIATSKDPGTVLFQVCSSVFVTALVLYHTLSMTSWMDRCMVQIDTETLPYSRLYEICDARANIDIDPQQSELFSELKTGNIDSEIYAWVPS